MELIVVMGILAAMLALLLPAIQTARQAARRTTCLNHLRQIGLGLLVYHEVHQAFPPGGIEWRPPGRTEGRQLAWSAFLLPFIEQQEVYDQLDLTLAFDHPANSRPASAILPMYVCPTASRGLQTIEGRGPSDYGGIFGERITSPNQPPKGLMIYDQAFSLADVLDGASKTLAVAEDTEWSDGQWINGRNVFDQAFAVNAAPPFENDIRSGHPGGAQGVLADASVIFLTNDMDLRVLAAYCTRAGGELP